jgi:hypothetical protein
MGNIYMRGHGTQIKYHVEESNLYANHMAKEEERY